MRRVSPWIACVALLIGCAGNPRTQGELPEPETPPILAQDGALADECGVEIVGVWLSAAGYMIDFRYRVVDPEKAKPLLGREGEVRPYLIDQATDSKLFVPSSPKVGPLRQTTQEPTEGRVYYALFANPGGLVKPGGRVTVVIGDFRAQDLVVQ